MPSNFSPRRADSARVLAGGTDVIVQMETDLIEPELLIDIKRIPDLHRIAIENGGFRIGAAVSAMAMMDHAALCAAWPGVIDGVKLIGSIQVKGRATMAGNLCNASPGADSVPPLVTAGAIARVVGPDGTRDVPVEQIPVGPGKTSLAKGEIVESFFLPSRPRNSGRRLPALHAAHRDGHRRGRRRRQSLSRRRSAPARRLASRWAPSRRPCSSSRTCADALIGTKVDDAALDRSGRRRECGVPADRRQARHQGIPDQDRRRAGETCGPEGPRTGEAYRMSKKYHVTTNVNGDEYEFLCEPQQTLLDVLRDELQLTGTKEGCATGDCGACSVMLDGQLVCSCLVLAVEAEGKTIETIEGMARATTCIRSSASFSNSTVSSAASARPEFWSRPVLCSNAIPTRPKARCATGSPAISAAAPAMTRSSARFSLRPRK